MQSSSCVCPSYMLQQTDINEKMRAILIDWLIEVCNLYGAYDLYNLQNIVSDWDINNAVWRGYWWLTGALQVWIDGWDLILDCESHRQILRMPNSCKEEAPVGWRDCHASSMQVWGSLCSCGGRPNSDFRQSIHKRPSFGDGNAIRFVPICTIFVEGLQLLCEHFLLFPWFSLMLLTLHAAQFLQEKLMINTLQFNLSVPTPYVFMRRFLKAAQCDKKVMAIE